MCGRYTLTAHPTELALAFGIEPPADLRPRYNIAPTQAIEIVRAGAAAGQSEWARVRWGLVPRWAEDSSIGARMINARSETVAEKPSFRDAFKKRRCLVPADGYYEWKEQAGKKQPYLFRLAGGKPFAIAGIWERWTGPDGNPLESCALLTTAMHPDLVQYHDRMPVLLPPDQYDRWLDHTAYDPAWLATLLQPCSFESLVVRPVSRVVSSGRVDGPECWSAPDGPGG